MWPPKRRIRTADSRNYGHTSELKIAKIEFKNENIIFSWNSHSLIYFEAKPVTAFSSRCDARLCGIRTHACPAVVCVTHEKRRKNWVAEQKISNVSSERSYKVCLKKIKACKKCFSEPTRSKVLTKQYQQQNAWNCSFTSRPVRQSNRIQSKSHGILRLTFFYITAMEARRVFGKIFLREMADGIAESPRPVGRTHFLGWTNSPRAAFSLIFIKLVKINTIEGNFSASERKFRERAAIKYESERERLRHLFGEFWMQIRSRS